MEKLSSVAILKKYFVNLKTEEMKGDVLPTAVRIELADLAAAEMGYKKEVAEDGTVSYVK